MLNRDFRPGGTVNIHWKDLGYALSLAKEEDVPLPVTALVHEIFKAARADGKGGLCCRQQLLLAQMLPPPTRTESHR